MFQEIYNFWSEWLNLGSHNVLLPIPFTNGGEIEITYLLSVFSVGLIVFSAVWFIVFMVKTILRMFVRGV